MGEATQKIPKPMITVGGQPILWHIMRWYASWEHTEFVLCLGHQAESVMQFFDAHTRWSNKGCLPVNADEDDADESGNWRITFLTPASTRRSVSDCERRGCTWATTTSSSAPTAML